MRRWIPAIFIPILVFGLASTASSLTPKPLSTLRAVHELSNEQASNRLAASFEATITYYRAFDHVTFLQDGDAAIFVQSPPGATLATGDRVLVRGTTRGSFRPFVVAREIVVLHHGVLPVSERASFDDLIRAKFDCRLVTVRGVIRSADLEPRGNSALHSTTLQILTDGGYIEASIDSDDGFVLKSLLDAEVEVTGVSAGKFDGKMQQTGVLLHVSTLTDVKTIEQGWGPQSLPITPMDSVIQGYHVQDLTQRIRVRGTITYDQPGFAVVLQSGDKSLWVMTRSLTPYRVGDLAYATGFPDAHDGSLTLTRGEVEDTYVQSPVPPLPSTWDQMTMRGNDLRDHTFDLVSIEGTVTTEEREATQDEYVLFSDGHMFSAIYRHPAESSQLQLAPMKVIPPGSRVRVSGICIVDDFVASDNHVPFNILLNSVADITVVAKPSWLTIRNLSYVISGLLLVVAASGFWGWSLTRKVRRQSRALATRIEAEAALERRMAQIEQRRSRILEYINGAESLNHILGEITELVTFLMNGAPCWCGIRDDLSAGFRPARMDGLRSLEVEISPGSGSVSGSLVVWFDQHIPESAQENEALLAGARLATLAIENRRLYDDLRHRSEHDLLTDIPNRFRLERQIEGLIERSGREDTAFGLIYIDLDQFKQVNDSFGHRSGDLYLQKAASRMMQQLRSEDMLARIGGDEFIALVPIRRNRGDADEIAARLERCFDEPFELEGPRVCGSASIGVAIYPEDGTNKEELQRAADTAMYLHKQSKRTAFELAEEQVAS